MCCMSCVCLVCNRALFIDPLDYFHWAHDVSSTFHQRNAVDFSVLLGRNVPSEVDVWDRRIGIDCGYLLDNIVVETGHFKPLVDHRLKLTQV